MRRTQLSMRTSAILSAGALTIYQDGFDGSEDQSVTINSEAARALLPILVKFASGASTGTKARSRSDEALVSSPSDKRQMRNAATKQKIKKIRRVISSGKR